MWSREEGVFWEEETMHVIMSQHGAFCRKHRVQQSQVTE